MTRRRKKLLVLATAGAGVVVVAGVGGPYVYIHFIEGPPPAKLQLPKAAAGASSSGKAAAATSTSTTSATSAPASKSLAGAGKATLTGAAGVGGTWNVTSGSQVGYRVHEVLVGQHTTAVGRTEEVWGSLTISGSTVKAATFTANMSSVKSDQSGRNAQFDGRIMDVAAYPTSKFQLTHPISLGALPRAGAAKKYQATGDLDMHGVTRQVSFPVSAERTADGIYALADIDISFGDWKIANPSIAGLVTTQDHGILEVLLHLTKGPGNPSYATAEESRGTGGPAGFAGGHKPGGKLPAGGHHAGGFGGGHPPAGGAPNVTVPKTTVPPLTVPSSTSK